MKAKIDKMSKVIRLNDSCCNLIIKIREMEKFMLDNVPKIYNPRPMTDVELIEHALACQLQTFIDCFERRPDK